jgi:hypothetical protein
VSNKASAELIKALLSAMAVSQVTAAKVIGVSDRSMRKYCAHGAPLVVSYALQYFAENRRALFDRLGSLGLGAKD